MAWWEGLDETRVLIAPGTEAGGNNLGELLQLRHPKSGNETCYLSVNETLQEVNWFKQSHGSWFLGEYVSKDGSLYMATPVDPVFILLPIFEEARMKKGESAGMFRQLDEILSVEGYPGYQHLLSLAENCMQVVCETQDFGSTKFYRLDDSKVLAWLNYKVCQVKKSLPLLDTNYAARDEKDTLSDAILIIGEYVKAEPWLKLLCDHLRIDFPEVTKKESATNGVPKDINPEPFNSFEEKKTVKKAVKSGTQNKKAKVETESRNIRDMFSRACKRKN